jgi:hypothetical protein
LHSLDRLDQCRRTPEQPECQSAGAGVSAVAGSEQGGTDTGGASAEGGRSGSNEPTAGIDSLGGAMGTAGLVGDGGAAGAAQELPELVVLYADYSDSDVDPEASTMLRAAFSIVNRSDVDVSLASVTLRYYYTLEEPSVQTYFCDAVSPTAVVNDCEGIKVAFGTLSPLQDYAEISFQPPDGEWLVMAPGGTSGAFRLRFAKVNYGEQDQTNDWSFRQSDGMVPEDEQDHITLYIDGKLVWGIEPP